MTRLPHAESFRDLVVYQKSQSLSQEIFTLTKTFPKEEMFSLTDQIRRSSRSIGAQIAEAWAKRRYEKHFISKLTDADGERQETQHWIATAAKCGYVDEDLALELKAKYDEIGHMLFSMITKSHLFCGEIPDKIREPLSEYFVESAESLGG